MTTRIGWLGWFGLLLFGPQAHGQGRPEGPAPRRPNVVVIVADDMGYSDLGCYGGEIATPHLDRLAAGGLRFTQAYNAARCWTSRAAILTGYYAQQVNRDPPHARPLWAATLPQLIAPAGYRSYLAGKWHLDGPVRPAGFARSYEIAEIADLFRPTDHRLDDRPLPRSEPEERSYATIATADRAIEWLAEHERDHKADPFLLYLTFIVPHFPLHALPEDIERYHDRYAAGWDVTRDRRWRRMKELGVYDGPLSALDPAIIPSWSLSEADLRKRIGPGEVGRAVPWASLTPDQKRFQATKMAIHAAMVDRMDRETGRVVAQLEASGRLDETLILFVSDNGASAEQIIRGGGHDLGAIPGSATTYLGLGPGWASASNTPFRLHKSFTHEGGIATPLIAHWPAGIRARGELRHTPVHLIDIVPTVLALAGVASPATWGGAARPPLPGRDLSPTFAADATIDRPSLYFDHAGNRALRAGDLKIVARKDGPWELYDLANDRAEGHDLAAARPGDVARLAALWAEQQSEFRRERATAPGRPGTEPTP